MANLTAMKNRHQSEVCNSQLNNEDFLSDSLSDVLPFDVELSSNQSVPETPPVPPCMTQSIPLAVLNSGAKLPSLSLPPPVRSTLLTIDQNAPFVQFRYSSHSPTDDHQRKVELIGSFGGNIITTAMPCIDILFTDKDWLTARLLG